MDAKALICTEQQNFALADVVLNDPAPDQVAIRTHFTGVSIGTEFGLISGKISKADHNPFPLCTGYQGTGVIETVGTAIDNFAVGDEVYFRGNDAMALADGTEVGCLSGGHCSYVVTQPNTTHGVAKMVPGAAMDVASLFVMPAVGLYGVDMANPQMGQTVVVHGVGMIGLGVVAACVHRGCVVVAVDIDEKPLEVARALGADYTIHGTQQDVAAAVMEIAPDGADVVFECTGHPQCIDPAIALCRRFGSFVWQGHYGDQPVPMNFPTPHGKRLKMFFPCDDGLQPCRRAVIKNMAMGALQWEHCITHRIGCGEMAAMFERIKHQRDGDIIGVVVDWRN
jgi:L-iditol 2-dehydrogenase